MYFVIIKEQYNDKSKKHLIYFEVLEEKKLNFNKRT